MKSESTPMHLTVVNTTGERLLFAGITGVPARGTVEIDLSKIRNPENRSRVLQAIKASAAKGTCTFTVKEDSPSIDVEVLPVTNGAVRSDTHKKGAERPLPASTGLGAEGQHAKPDTLRKATAPAGKPIEPAPDIKTTEPERSLPKPAKLNRDAPPPPPPSEPPVIDVRAENPPAPPATEVSAPAAPTPAAPAPVVPPPPQPQPTTPSLEEI